MAVRIRMKKMGRKHRPFFRICVMDSQVQRDGKAIEEVGFYDPMVHDKAARVKMNMERVDYWISVGAQPSEKVNALIRKVRTNRFGTAKAPPPMIAPKAREAAPAAEPAEAAAE
ncbi:MAG: ribosomal protein [Planctomycetota bacterium]|jgi:small subunit ribosomal protein S16